MVATQNLVLTRSDVANTSRSARFVITTEGVLFIFFVGGLAWVPFWFGSNRPIPWGINAILFPGLAVLYELSLLMRGRPHPVAIRRIWLSAALFVAAVSWALVQIATCTPTAWQHPIWGLASEALGRSVPGSISVDRDLTAIALLTLMTAASVFWLALQLSHEAMRARMLIWAVVGIIAAYSAAGIFALGFMPNGRIFAELAPSKFVTSTFVNQNHFVTFAGIGFIGAVAMTLRLFRRQLSQTGSFLRLKLAGLIATTGTKGALPLALTFVVLTALLLTGSRGGIIATALAFLVLLVLNTRRKSRTPRNDALILLFAAIVIGAVFMGFSDVFVGRVGVQGLYDEGRWQAYSATMRSITTSPILGFGYGTFLAVFPMFRDDSMDIWSFWDKAHNTYLEVLQGLGLVFGTLLIASVFVLVWQCLQGARTRQRNATIPAIAASVSFLVGVHALVDFSLQIQAVTLTYMAILGAGVAQATDEPFSSRARLPMGHTIS